MVLIVIFLGGSSHVGRAIKAKAQLETGICQFGLKPYLGLQSTQYPARATLFEVCTWVA